MKSPDEIKKGLECCITDNCNECPYRPLYDVWGCKLARAQDALALIQQLEARIPRWISVEERLPRRYERVLVATGFADESEQDVEVAYLAIDRWRSPYGPLYGKVAHWMPLPEPPVEG